VVTDGQANRTTSGVFGDPIMDPDTPVVSISDAPVMEGDSNGTVAHFSVGVSVPSMQPIALGWYTDDVTAVSGQDYEAQADVLVIPPGVTTAEIAIPILPDMVPEATEIFFVQLTYAVHAEIGRGLGHGIIRDPSGPRFNAKADFDRNGRADVMLHYVDPDRGDHAPWHDGWSIDGTSATPLPQPSPPPGPSTSTGPTREDHLVALDDLNRDGKLDELTASDLRYWLNDTELEVEAPGQLVGTGDFNWDGVVDVLFWDPAAAQLSLWESGRYFPGPPLPVENQADHKWHPVGVARLTSSVDRMPDIVWQHDVTGELQFWHMRWQVDLNPPSRRLVFAYGGPLQPSLPPTEDGVTLQLAAMGDFDGDGKDDLLWRNPVTRKVGVWFMLNAARRTNRTIPLSPDTFDRHRTDGSLLIDWSITGPR
jgi:Calx-beta domain-containing protein/FG-GAP repeat protein